MVMKNGKHRPWAGLHDPPATPGFDTPRMEIEEVGSLIVT